MLELIKMVIKHVLINIGLAKDTYIPPSLPPKKYQPTDTLPRIPLVEDGYQPLQWKGIVVHHSASPDGMQKDAEGIVKYHTSYRIDYNIVSKEEFERRKKAKQGKVFQEPWKAVGYHYLVEYVGSEIILYPGRSLSVIGAHAGHKVSNRFNKEYIGVCVIGDYDKTMPSKEIIKFTQGVVRTLMDRFSFTKDKVIGHREVFDKLGVPREKSCPGNLFDMNKFREELS